MEHIQKLIQESRRLIDYASCMEMATGYKVGKINSANYSRLLQEAEKEAREKNNMDKKNEVIDKIINAYFEHPKKTLEEVFGEYTESLSEEETKIFYDNLKAIVN